VTQRIPRVHLNPDNFLYACHSEDVARTRKNGTFKSHLRYEPFLVENYQRPKSPSVAALRVEILAIGQHHFQTSPQFRRNEDVDLDTISYFTLGIATLFADLNRIFFEFTGLDLPKIPSHDTEYSDSFPLLQKIINQFTAFLANDDLEKDPFNPFSVSSQKNNHEVSPEQSEFSAEIWDIVSEIIFETFPNHAAAIMSYASWKFKMDEVSEPIDWRIRPPVGELFAKAFRSLRNASSPGGFSRSGASSGGPKGTHKGGERPRKTHDSEKAPQLEAKSPRPAKKDFANQEHQAPERKHDAHRKHDGKHKISHGQHEPKQQIQSDDDLAPYLEEAQAAVTQLQNNKGLAEVKLSASNSFIRRHQHSLLVELGFETESRGEGRDRCIYVKQK
jgi:hypothetical protein